MKKSIQKAAIVLLLFSQSIISQSDIEKERAKERTNKMILYKLQSGEEEVLQYITYERLEQFSQYVMGVRDTLSLRGFSVVDILYGSDKRTGQYNVVKGVLGGLLNRDPKVRLYCSRLLLKLGIKRGWVEISIQRALDPEGFSRETVDRLYSYKDIYGYMHRENLKYALPRVLEVGSQLILLLPKEGDEVRGGFEKKGIFFEWTTLYDAKTYDFYIGEMLYYSGMDSFVYMKNLSIEGSVEWRVVARGETGNYLASKSSSFLYSPKKPNPIQSDSKSFPKKRKGSSGVESGEEGQSAESSVEREEREERRVEGEKGQEREQEKEQKEGQEEVLDFDLSEFK